jgi:hypothetical protein
MKYQNLPPITHELLEKALAGPLPDAAAEALLRMALNEPDWRWAEQVCLVALRDRREEVRAAAITSFGHLARIHHALSTDVVVPRLVELQDDPKLGGLAEDAIEDILMFAVASSASS